MSALSTVALSNPWGGIQSEAHGDAIPSPTRIRQSLSALLERPIVLKSRIATAQAVAVAPSLTRDEIDTVSASQQRAVAFLSRRVNTFLTHPDPHRRTLVPP